MLKGGRFSVFRDPMIDASGRVVEANLRVGKKGASSCTAAKQLSPLQASKEISYAQPSAVSFQWCLRMIVKT